MDKAQWMDLFLMRLKWYGVLVPVDNLIALAEKLYAEWGMVDPLLVADAERVGLPDFQLTLTKGG